MVEQNSSSTQEILRPVQRRAAKGMRATRDWFGERSTAQWILMILVPVLLISAVAGYFIYRSRSGSRTVKRTARKSRVRARANTTGTRRRRAGRRTTAPRARGRRTRRGRAVAAQGPGMA
jgi:hypothetical protein